MRGKEEVQEQLDKIAKYRISADEKEQQLREEMTQILMQKYVSGFRSLQRNHEEISKTDFEVFMKGFAKEIIELYTGTHPW